MFVRRSTYEAMQERAALASEYCRGWQKKYLELHSEWNALVKRINALGGEEFLKGAAGDLSKDDIQRLLMLCHPDKHDGKPMATEMTQKLLKLRDKS